MARLNVNPTRMEMTRLKGQLKTATRGHKLLKDKLDELMKQFMEIVRENKRLREEAETALENAYKNFIIARAVLSEASLGEALMIPQQSVSVKVTKKNIMSVNVPVFDFQKEGGGDGNIFPYGMAFTSGELDSAMLSFSDAMEPLLRLAESEKTAQLLAQEIERKFLVKWRFQTGSIPIDPHHTRIPLFRTGTYCPSTNQRRAGISHDQGERESLRNQPL